jgi:hypothetical protein
MKIQKYNYPWEHYVIDDFLSEKRFHEIKTNVDQEETYLDMFGYYSRRNHYYRYDKYDVLPELNLLLKELFPNKNKNLKKINHWSIHPENFHMTPHIDNESRLYTAVLYIEPKDNIGTILCKNDSQFKEDHGLPDRQAEEEIEVEFKPNRLFIHKSEPNTWHRFSSTTKRITFNSWLVDPNLIIENRIEHKFLIDI